MTYQEAIDYLYVQMPMFQQIGNGAYKAGLETTMQLDEHFGHPHRSFRTVHIAGTNGKGSTAHTLAAIFQSAGYRTGLYTSPHILDFSERIRVDGKPIDKNFVVKFITENRQFYEPLKPSFFELTTAMAFRYFADCKVDIAIIETGLGGRLDCTNIITPELSVITNIGFDHTLFLGDTLAKIAFEKAGIIKPGVPAVIGEDVPETREVFQNKADGCGSKIVFAQDKCKIISEHREAGRLLYDAAGFPELESELQGFCQRNNANTILYAVDELRLAGWNLPDSAVRDGFAHVCNLTSLMGRWQKLSERPAMVCDTGHNSHGLKYVAAHLSELMQSGQYSTLRIVFGMVNDKDVDRVLELMPAGAVWYFTQAGVKRAMPAGELRNRAEVFGHKGRIFPTVAEAVSAAISDADPSDLIYAGGSTFVVADLFAIPEFSHFAR